MAGYSTLTAREIREANSNLLGVKLGRFCLDRGIPVADAAEYLHVSRVTVYAWFRGKADVSGHHRDAVIELLKKLA